MSSVTKRLLPVVMLVSLASVDAFADIDLALSVQTPQMMGTQWNNFKSGLGGALEAWLPSSELLSGLTFHFQGDVQQFALKSDTGGQFSVTTLLGGAHFKGHPEKSSLSLMMGADLGVSYEYLSVTGATTASSTGTLGFAMQLTPGVDIPVTQKLGIVFETPIRWIVQKTSLRTWQSSFGLRWSI